MEMIKRMENNYSEICNEPTKWELFSGWLGWGASNNGNDNASQPLREKQTTEPPTPVYPKFGLADALREATSVAMSPNEKLAAVTDSLGRIILIDVHKGIAVRIWKGKHDSKST